MSWRKLTKQPLFITSAPTTFDAKWTIKYDASEEKLYMMTGRKTWAAFPIGTKYIIPDIESGEILTSGSAAFILDYLYSGDGTIALSGEALYESEGV